MQSDATSNNWQPDCPRDFGAVSPPTQATCRSLRLSASAEDEHTASPNIADAWAVLLERLPDDVIAELNEAAVQAYEAAQHRPVFRGTPSAKEAKQLEVTPPGSPSITC